MIAKAASANPLTATAAQRKIVWPESFLRVTGELADGLGVVGRWVLLMTVYFNGLRRFVELQKTGGGEREAGSGRRGTGSGGRGAGDGERGTGSRGRGAGSGGGETWDGRTSETWRWA